MAERRDAEPIIIRRRPRTPAGIPYSTVEAVAARMHRIDEDGIPALRARLHSLRRLDFPNGVSGSSGRHFDYEVSDLIAVLTALELAEAYVPPAAAVAIVREGWPEIARSALHGIANKADEAVVTVYPNALLQALGNRDQRVGETMHVEIAALAPANRGRRTIEVPVGTIANQALEALDRLDPRAATLARHQLAALDGRFGNGQPLPRPEQRDGRFRADGPYWSRARSLVAAAAGGAVTDADRRRATWQLDYLVWPAPVEAWKTRVEVHPDLDDVGYAAALAALAHRSGLRATRRPIPAVDADRIWSRLAEAVGAPSDVAFHLTAIALQGERAARPA